MIKLRNLPEASPAIKIIKLHNAGILRKDRLNDEKHIIAGSIWPILSIISNYCKKKVLI